MNDRPTRMYIGLAVAMLQSKRSTCLRLQVGCAITKKGRVISTGYNGTKKGEEHCNPQNCNEHEPCNKTTHAEANAIQFAHKMGIDLTGTNLYCTHQPCLNCAKKIVKAGIKKVVYIFPYRKLGGLRYLIQNNIQIINGDE